MLIRDILGTTLVGLVAAALALAPGALHVSPTGPSASVPGSGLSGSPGAEVGVLHPCPETTESECRAVFLPPLASSDGDGAAHTSHAPQVQICGPLDEGVSWQSVSSCDDPGTGEQVEFFPFGCGDVNECVEVRANHYQVNWHTAGPGDEEDGDGDEDEDAADGDQGAEGGEGIENGHYLIDVRLNGNSGGGVVVEIGQGGGGATPPKINNGSTVPIKFRLHDKIVG